MICRISCIEASTLCCLRTIAISIPVQTAIQSCVFTAFLRMPKNALMRRRLLDPVEEELSD